MVTVLLNLKADFSANDYSKTNYVFKQLFKCNEPVCEAMARHMGCICRPDVRMNLELESHQSLTSDMITHPNWVVHTIVHELPASQLCTWPQLGQVLWLVRRYIFEPVMDLGPDTKSIWAGAGTKTREMKELGGALENHVVPSEKWWVLWVTSHLWEAGPGMGPVSIFYPQFPKLAAQLNEVWLWEGHI